MGPLGGCGRRVEVDDDSAAGSPTAMRSSSDTAACSVLRAAIPPKTAEVIRRSDGEC